MTYPRSRNGWVDDGRLITASNRQDRCPNCGSDRYRETVSMERCEACGLQMDYWGKGGNLVYESYLARRRAQQQAAEEERQRAQEREWQEEQNWHSRVREDDWRDE